MRRSNRHGRGPCVVWPSESHRAFVGRRNHFRRTTPDRGGWSGNGLWRETAELQDNWRRARAHLPLEKVAGPIQTIELPMVDVLRLRRSTAFACGALYGWNEGVRDFSDVLAEGGPMVEPLKAPEYFARAFVEMGAPTWLNGFDVDRSISMWNCATLAR